MTNVLPSIKNNLINSESLYSPLPPGHLSDICDFWKKMLQMFNGGTRIFVQIPSVELRDDCKCPTQLRDKVKILIFLIDYGTNNCSQINGFTCKQRRMYEF